MTVEELSKGLASEIRNIATGSGYIGMTFSFNLTEPKARLQITLRPKSILIKKVPDELGTSGKGSDTSHEYRTRTVTRPNRQKRGQL